MIFWMKGREGLGLIGLALGHVGDDADVEVHAHLVAVVDAVAGGGTLQNGQTDVDGVAVENPGKAGGDDAGDAGGLDGQGRVLPGGAAAEVLARPP